ncbi:Uncharacterised protein [Mycobacteroides abscessus subsp. abscessus]|nr:Uncharacterised protein [Mycobacteroides abscessus subsp. abscessus]
MASVSSCSPASGTRLYRFSSSPAVVASTVQPWPVSHRAGSSRSSPNHRLDGGASSSTMLLKIRCKAPSSFCIAFDIRSAWFPGAPKSSTATRLPGADRSAMRSNNKSWAAPGRKGSSPSASHAVGCAGSNPAALSTVGQSSRRSTCRSRTVAVARALCSSSTCFLNSSTFGRSSSYTVVPAAQGRRYPRTSRPAASITACRTPALPAVRKNSSKYLVRAPR